MKVRAVDVVNCSFFYYTMDSIRKNGWGGLETEKEEEKK